jgi:hypothetical protein
MWDSATHRVRVVPRPDHPGERRISLDDVIVAVCFLALISLVLIGGPLMLLSRVTATLPVSPPIACPEFDGCVVAEPNENDAVLVEDQLNDGLTITR